MIFNNQAFIIIYIIYIYYYSLDMGRTSWCIAWWKTIPAAYGLTYTRGVAGLLRSALIKKRILLRNILYTHRLKGFSNNEELSFGQNMSRTNYIHRISYTYMYLSLSGLWEPKWLYSAGCKAWAESKNSGHYINCVCRQCNNAEGLLMIWLCIIWQISKIQVSSSPGPLRILPGVWVAQYILIETK